MVIGRVAVVVVLSGCCCVVPWLLMESPEGLLLQDVSEVVLEACHVDNVCSSVRDDLCE